MQTQNANLKGLKIKIASPEDIMSWSHGEVIKPETINYRTQRPEKDGLFSERIFGPTKDWECYCGKYRKIRYKGVTCDKCGVEVTRSVVRRERMAHITLATPVAHTWFLRSVPSVMSLVLDEPLKKLERVIYYAAYIVLEVDEEKRTAAISEVEKEYEAHKNDKTKDAKLETSVNKTLEFLRDLHEGSVLSEQEFIDLGRRFGNVFTISSGGEGIREVLEKIDLGKTIIEIEKELERTKDATRRSKLLRRLKLLKSMKKNNIRPEWMVLTVLPVLPPDLRPMVALDGGRYATSDLNDLYRRIINRNNRLKKLLELNAPDVIVINEKRMLQEAVDVLIDNSRTKQTARGRRPLKSLSDMLKGKQGRFRQNLLGKRVDYSGRSVIVIGPHLNLDQCGLPKRMALELFRPFVINKIIERGLAYNIRNANRLIDQAPAEVWEILEDIISKKKVLLNRAPTLHRLSIQAFKPVLVEDLAIQIPPMVCKAFNADFDGDQMAVHVPLSAEAQWEASNILMSNLNLLKPASGEAETIPTQDIVLGCHYLTRIPIKYDGKSPRKALSTVYEVGLAYENKYIELNEPIRFNGMTTTYGRVMFNEVLPEDHEFVNETLTKKSIGIIIGNLINQYDNERIMKVLDDIKTLGFKFADISSGLSVGIGDMIVSDKKEPLLAEGEKKVDLINTQFQEGLLTEYERKSRIIESWLSVKNKVDATVADSLGSDSPITITIESGARGSWGQANQIIGMKGNVANPKGEEIELPIRTALKEGHTSLEYFISTHGARKGLVDTALRTAGAGYLTRRLIDVAQDVVIKEENCRTQQGITLYREEDVTDYTFSDRLISRVALNDIKIGKKVVVKGGEIIYSDVSKIISDSDTEEVEVRSPLTCTTLFGICAKCYGLDLGSNKPVRLGEAVGIVAAQSIGELGTQLTLLTFHKGGVAGSDITMGLPRVEELFERRVPKNKATLSDVDGTVTDIETTGATKTIFIQRRLTTGKKNKTVEYSILQDRDILVKVGDKVLPGDQLTDGSIDPKELAEYKDKIITARYLIKEIQRIYRSEGAIVHDKHMEIIIRQMFNRVEIITPGDTEFIVGEVIDKSRFKEVNNTAKAEGRERAKGKELILGITKSVLSGDGFLAAASFQETTRVLIKAASEGREDRLRGLKENVIIGRLVPVGTAVRDDIKLEKPKEEG